MKLVVMNEEPGKANRPIHEKVEKVSGLVKGGLGKVLEKAIDPIKGIKTCREMREDAFFSKREDMIWDNIQQNRTIMQPVIDDVAVRKVRNECFSCANRKVGKTKKSDCMLFQKPAEETIFDKLHKGL